MYSSLAAVRLPVAEGMTLIQRCPRPSCLGNFSSPDLRLGRSYGGFVARRLPRRRRHCNLLASVEFYLGCDASRNPIEDACCSAGLVLSFCPVLAARATSVGAVANCLAARFAVPLGRHHVLNVIRVPAGHPVPARPPSRLASRRGGLTSNRPPRLQVTGHLELGSTKSIHGEISSAARA